MDEEIWLPLNLELYCDFYEVSNYGRVRSKDRMVERGKWGRFIRRGKVIRNGYHPFGYPIVCLKAFGMKKMERVHKLVALSFVPNETGGSYVLHRDNNPKNNYYKNLMWGTPLQNIRQSVTESRHGRKLTWELARKIRYTWLAGGMTQTKIAADFGVSKVNVSYILKNKIWKIELDPLNQTS